MARYLVARRWPVESPEHVEACGGCDECWDAYAQCFVCSDDIQSEADAHVVDHIVLVEDSGTTYREQYVVCSRCYTE